MTPTPPPLSSFQSHFRLRRSRNANQYDSSHNSTPTAPPPVAPLVDDRFNEDGDLLEDDDVDDDEEGADDGDDSNLEQEGNDGEEEDEDDEEGGIEEGLFLYLFPSLSVQIFFFDSPTSCPNYTCVDRLSCPLCLNLEG
jgi:hypothetical protein